MKENPLKSAKKLLGVLICALIILINFTPQMRLVRGLSDKLYLTENETINALDGILPISMIDNEGRAVASDLSESLGQTGYRSKLTIELFGIPIKEVHVVRQSEIMVMPCGQSIGVKLYTQGALVVGFGDVAVQDGKTARPAELAGIMIGDIVIGINGVEIENAAHVTNLCNVSDGMPVTVKVLREGMEHNLIITPAYDIIENEYKLGLWVRDSTAGIGTLSFYTMHNRRYGALGHAITDIDTGAELLVKNGEIVLASVVGVSGGEQGTPGEIKGTFGAVSRRLGSILLNSDRGLFGMLYQDIPSDIYPDGLPLAYPEEAKLGKAAILSTVDGAGVAEYACEIIRIYDQKEPAPKGMVIKITDKNLIEKTGGIVQGMSGSPLIQDGKLLGVVTHVFVNDPQKGYCIYALWMID